MSVICFGALVYDFYSLRFLGKVTRVYVLFLGQVFIMHVFYIFTFAFVQRNRACATRKSSVEVK